MRKRLSIFSSLCIMAFMLVACGSRNASPSTEDLTSTVEAPTTEASTTEAPTTEAPTTEAPTTEAPTTEAPTTEEPTTETPTTETPSPTPTETPAPEPTVPPVEDDDEPTKPSEWNGDYDNLVGDDFDHIKVPTIDDFYDEGLSNDDGAFDFGNRPKWEEAWYDAYDEFLVALGSPVDDEGNVYPAFMSINPGYTQGYQYLYYGVNWSDDSNGWGDIVLYNANMHPQSSSTTNYNDAYFLELTNFTYGNMDKELEDEYRAATTMMLSWIVPNPQEVEKAIYDFHTDESGNDILSNLVDTQGCGAWVQIGEVDVCVTKYDFINEVFMFSIRSHR